MFIERYGRVFPSQRDSHLYVTPVTTLQYVKKHPEIIAGVRLGGRIYHSGIQGGIGLWSIVMTLFLRLAPEQAEQFTEHLTTARGSTAATRSWCCVTVCWAVSGTSIRRFLGVKHWWQSPSRPGTPGARARLCRRFPGAPKGAGPNRFQKPSDVPLRARRVQLGSH